MNRVTALIMIMMLSPLFAVISILLLLLQGRPVFFAQERVGKDFAPFMLLKFRSMRNDAEKHGAQFAVENDPRVTRIGNVLRKTHLDELPQLWNVVCGHMNFIGPRPERKQFVSHYPCSHRWTIKPGITGWAQIHDTYLDISEKCLYDEYYIEHRSHLLHTRIVLGTLKRMIGGRNAH